jgi:hypothetical protein
LLLAANSCVQGITKLCDLYKQSKSNFLKIKSTAEEIASDAKAVRSWWQRLFETAPITPKFVAKKAEKFVDYNESQAMADIVAELTKFWTLQDKLTEYLRTEEEKAKVYDPSVTNAEQMQNAMNRILCQQEMAKLDVTIREIMVYQTSGLADLYTQTYEMRGVIREEQEKARLAKERRDKEMAWQLRQEARNFHLKVAWVIATFTFLLYLWLWLILVSRWQKT